MSATPRPSSAQPDAAARPSTLPELIDRKGLMGLGLGEESVERMKIKLSTIRLPGDRKIYWRREEVAAYLEEHTVPPMRGAA